MSVLNYVIIYKKYTVWLQYVSRSDHTLLCTICYGFCFIHSTLNFYHTHIQTHTPDVFISSFPPFDTQWPRNGRDKQSLVCTPRVTAWASTFSTLTIESAQVCASAWKSNYTQLLGRFHAFIFTLLILFIKHVY